MELPCEIQHFNTGLSQKYKTSITTSYCYMLNWIGYVSLECKPLKHGGLKNRTSNLSEMAYCLDLYGSLIARSRTKEYRLLYFVIKFLGIFTS